MSLHVEIRRTQDTAGLSQRTEVVAEGALDEFARLCQAAAVEQVEHHAIAGAELALQRLRAPHDEAMHIFWLLKAALQHHAVACRTAHNNRLVMQGTDMA